MTNTPSLSIRVLPHLEVLEMLQRADIWQSSHIIPLREYFYQISNKVNPSYIPGGLMWVQNSAVASLSCIDGSANVFPICSWISKSLGTHQARHTDSALVSSASLWWGGTHFWWQVLLYMLAVISTASSMASYWALSRPMSTQPYGENCLLVFSPQSGTGPSSHCVPSFGSVVKSWWVPR